MFVANVSCVYPLKAIVIMSSASRHAKRTSVNNQTKPNLLSYLCLQSPARGSLNTDKILEFILILLGMPVIMYIIRTKALSTD